MNRPVYHLRDPRQGERPACGEESAHLTKWRRHTTCQLCLQVTAPSAFDVPVVGVAPVHVLPSGEPLPIRMTALARFLRSMGPKGDEAASCLESEAAVAGAWCPGCKTAMPDPIAVVDMGARRTVFACPRCSSQTLRQQWEREGMQ